MQYDAEAWYARWWWLVFQVEYYIYSFLINHQFLFDDWRFVSIHVNKSYRLFASEFLLCSIIYFMSSLCRCLLGKGEFFFLHDKPRKICCSILFHTCSIAHFLDSHSSYSGRKLDVNIYHSISLCCRMVMGWLIFLESGAKFDCINSPNDVSGRMIYTFACITD